VELVALGRHVVGVEEVAVDVAVEALAGGCSPFAVAVRTTASVAISKRGCSSWSSPCQTSTNPQVVGEHHFERAVLLGPQEARLLRRLAHLRTVLVDDPGAC
jgi:hypothetical protein